MKAIDILKQSLNFYGRLFNKVFWLSIASSLSPLLMFMVIGSGQVSLVGSLLAMAISMFFSAYMMVLVHQFSQDQNDSLRDAFSLAVQKFFPIAGTSIVFGLFTILVGIPAAILAGVLSVGIVDEQLKVSLMAIVIAIPVSYVLYRCFFSVYFTLVAGTSPIDALKASNSLVKGNKLIFRGLMWLSLVMLGYVVLVVLIGLMVAVGPMAQAILEFAVNVIVLPYFTIFIYRLFVVAKEEFESKSQSSGTDIDADE